MKQVFTLLVAVLLTASVFAQAPEKISYQSVIRNSSDVLVTNTQIGMQISILQGSASGTAVYVETQSPTSNANGLVSIEIGGGTVEIGDFSTIDWANGPYFIQTETDPSGGTSYTITGTNQLLSVPYALHSKTAETITGGITETDPVFGAWDKSTGISITESQISDLDHFTTADETDPVFTAWDKSTGISITESQISDLDHFTTADETDPLFTAWDKNYADLTNTPTTITTEQANAIVANTAKVGITTAQADEIAANTAKVSAATGTVTGEMQYWNGTAWITVAAGNEGQVLTFVGGMPTWKPTEGKTDVTNPTTGKIWMDRNLGASQVATSSTDAASYGDLYQWGRGTDGHQIRTSGTTATNATTAVPNGGNLWDGLFITEGSSPFDWLTPQDNNLWQGVSGTNNPCPSGYRLPTDAELDAERLSWSSNNSAGAFGSPLKLPVAGHRNGGNGSLLDMGFSGRYWSSTVAGTRSWALVFGSSDAGMNSHGRANGRSVRCLKD